MKITADVMKISKTFQRDFTFIFDVLSESSLDFVSYSVLQALENVVSFTKKRFYTKRGSVTMRSYVETKIIVLQKIEICTPPPRQSAITRKRDVPQPNVLVFFLICSIFSISSTAANIVISRGKAFRGDPKKIHISLYIYKAW